MYWALIVLHVIVCTFLVLVVLLQAGKGGGMGIAFGGGGSQTVFGSSGAGNFLTKMTAVCAAIFFMNSLALAYLSSQSDSSRLKSLSEKQNATKQAETAAKNKVLSDVEKARQDLQKSGGAVPATGTPAGSATTTTPAPASGTAPAESAPTTPPAPATPPSTPPATATPPASSAPAPAGQTPPATP